MVVPIFVEQADTGARCLQCLCHLRLKMEAFSSLSMLLHLFDVPSLMRHFPHPLFGNQCYSSCATHRDNGCIICLCFFTQFPNNKSIS